MAENDPIVQIDSDHYYARYDKIFRWVSYYYQICGVKELQPSSVLEIGVGNSTVTNYLKQHGFRVTTCDIDKELGPDYVSDIRCLPFDNNVFDLVLACEVLEHIPWDEVRIALGEIHRVTSKHAFVSIPYSSAIVEIIIRAPLLDRLFSNGFIDFFLMRLPYFFRDWTFNGQHYWMMGRKGFPIKRIREAFEEYFSIKKEIRPALIPHLHYFALEKKRKP